MCALENEELEDVIHAFFDATTVESWLRYFSFISMAHALDCEILVEAVHEYGSFACAHG